ncbi:hypothetical protein Daura_37610 [Dactylosporangium aurantiacum]|uniref:Uncharacterized protein n=1 Tax=Dactylosporangium aurantiacum TaxID=35754 RepID=A0A9Q9IAB0_9ACTN|nr:hypothetical protein [Dactylosporangium aurantiacum]MDG6101864.1 hypothetical protein [Dactylosporangium aurantiacum]UWZ52337.1 hypothetical protein Daura_37610 [Dactylosporangium aurantiacum]
MPTTTQSPPIVVFAQHHRDGRWAAVAHGVPLDDRHCLLRAGTAGAVRPGARLRVVAVTGTAPEPVLLPVGAVSVLRDTGADLVMVTLTGADATLAAAAHGTGAAQVRAVLDLLGDAWHPLWWQTGHTALEVDLPGVATPGVPVLRHRVVADMTGGVLDGPLTWACRIFGIGCPDENSS